MLFILSADHNDLFTLHTSHVITGINYRLLLYIANWSLFDPFQLVPVLMLFPHNALGPAL